METYHFDIDPVAKPRMTQRDKWKNRPIITRYRAYSDLLRLQANQMGLETLPGNINTLVFHIPMPKSWSKKKKEAMNNRPHTQTPDLDNLLKGFQDVLCKDDKHIYSISRGLSKYWAKHGYIILVVD
jgi:Holliday junction resolvase RusA-like endonuclease